MAESPNPNVERLRQYWGFGQGALKIRWGTPHDFDRCVRELRRYIPSEREAEGFCANLHKRVLGGWPGDHNADGKRDH